jgi:thiamine-monophosphate kinase
VLGVGDDAALLRPTAGMELAISTDMLVSGQHFLPDTDPRRLGHKALSVNLSDLAAMGATPRWALLSLALPEADEVWLAAFAAGFFALAKRHGVELIGGDTTRGPLNINVTILGEVEAGRALRRDGAQVGDDIWVSGELGGAALALRRLRGEAELNADETEACRTRLETPEPRLALGKGLLGLAHAAIDISDGLLADLGHILEHSRKGARIEAARIPVAPALASRPDLIVPCAYSGGDDYELCFTAPAPKRNLVVAAAAAARTPISRIGQITASGGLELVGPDGAPLAVAEAGFDHFGTSIDG